MRFRNGLAWSLVAAASVLYAGCSSDGSSMNELGAANGDNGGADSQGDGGASSTGPGASSDGGPSGSGSEAGTPPPPPSGPTPGDFVMTAQGANSMSLSWTAAVPTNGATVDHYKIYRNGVAYATSAALTYTDSNATDATATTYSKPATIYTYGVSAVDSKGNESAQNTALTYWSYHQGNNNFGGDYSDVTLNYKDTAGAPAIGPFDISVTASGSVTNGYAQPYSGPPSVPEWALEVGGFDSMVLDLKPTVANQSWRLNIISRLPPGDVFNYGQIELPGSYGPAPEVGKWATYKVPLSVLKTGVGKFVGSISGTTLTVTSLTSGIDVEPGGWISGPGIAANTYLATNTGTGRGGAGTYTISPSQNVASTTIAIQRTNMYKFSLIDNTNTKNNVYYMDNVGFTAE